MANIPLAYPKIPGSKDAPSGPCVAFEKYDGTNLHWVWDREFGWVTFGTRRDSFYLDGAGIPEFTAAHPELREAPALFLRAYAVPLEERIQSRDGFGSGRVTVFTEFLGPNSFAGRHRADDPKELVLIDVQTDTGFLGPARLLEELDGLPVARVVYRGKLTGRFADDVRHGKYRVAEGVVCKGGEGDRLWMVKIKTDAYLARLREAFRDRWEDYWE